MHPRRLGPILLGMACLYVTVGPRISERNSISPVGPKMCARLCNEMFGCTSYVFMTSDLSCQLIGISSIPNEPGKGIYKIAMNKTMKYPVTIQKCRKNAKIFHTRRNSLHCLLPMQRKRGMTRLLITSLYASQVVGQQLFLHNSCVAMYSYISRRSGGFVTAVSYIASSRKLIISESRSKEMYFISLDSGEKSSIKVKEGAIGMTVDDSHQLVFYSHLQNVYVMSTDGKNLKSVVRYKYGLFDLAADSTRSVIYALRLFTHIDAFTYKGDFLGEVAKGKIQNNLCLDVEYDVLYYLIREPTTVIKMVLSTLSKTIVTELGFDAVFLYVFGDSFYVMGTKGMVVVSENGSWTPMTSAFKTYFGTEIRMCAIP